jgi:hypothetical protein
MAEANRPGRPRPAGTEMHKPRYLAVEIALGDRAAVKSKYA